MSRSGVTKIAPWALLGLLLIAATLAGVLLTQGRALAAPSQPVPYSHRVHTEKGIQCLFCHSSPLRSADAGIPSVQKCMGCHAVIATENSAIQSIADFAERGQEIPWNAVNDQPDFVFFSHQPHLGAGLNCETCHGEVGDMDEARPVNRMDMGWCLSCHLAQPEEKVARLTDCLACHQ